MGQRTLNWYFTFQIANMIWLVEKKALSTFKCRDNTRFLLLAWLWTRAKPFLNRVSTPNIIIIFHSFSNIYLCKCNAKHSNQFVLLHMHVKHKCVSFRFIAVWSRVLFGVFHYSKAGINCIQSFFMLINIVRRARALGAFGLVFCLVWRNSIGVNKL